MSGQKQVNEETPVEITRLKIEGENFIVFLILMKCVRFS